MWARATVYSSLNNVCFVSDCRGETKLSAFEGDIRDAAFLKATCRGAAVVFHMASIIDVSGTVKYSEMYEVNVTGKAATNPLKAHLNPLT